MDNLKEVKRRSDAIDNAFRQKGVKEIYTWAETEDHKKYNKFLGYKPTGKTVNDTFVDKEYPYEVTEYKKEL